MDSCEAYNGNIQRLRNLKSHPLPKFTGPPSSSLRDGSCSFYRSLGREDSPASTPQGKGGVYTSAGSSVPKATVFLLWSVHVSHSGGRVGSEFLCLAVEAGLFITKVFT